VNTTKKSENTNFKYLLAVISGLLCFFLSPFSVHYQIGKVSIDMPWSLVFPIILSLAYGRKAAIVSALSGAAFYQFLLWPNNGYANIINFIIFTTFYFTVGYLSEYAKQNRKSKQILIRTAVFSLGYATIFYLTFRYLFNIFLDFNPPFWAKYCINQMSVSVLHSIIAKTLINYVLIILFSDTLLKLPEVRKLFRLNTDNTMRRNSPIFIAAISIAIMIWGIFYSLDTLLSSNEQATKDYLLLSFMVIMWSSAFSAWSLIRLSESRLKAQNELKDNREYLESIIKNVPSIVFRCLNDSARTIKLVSNQISRITGYEVTDFINNSKLRFPDLIHPEDKEFIINSIRQQLKENQKFEIETRIIDKFEGVHWIIAKGRLQGDFNDESCFIDGAILDITEKKKTEKELKKYKDHLERLVEERTEQLENTLNELKHAQTQLIQSEKMASLGVLTAGVAHEINNPLNYIQASLFAIEENLKYKQDQDNLNANLGTLISTMKTGVNKATNIVKALNNFSHKGNQRKSICDLNNIINNCLLLLNHELKNKCFVNKDFTNKSFILTANEDGLHQVFTNLIMNSIQAIKAKGVIHMSTSLDENKSLLKIIVVDNGEGISKENLPKIFDPFFTTKAPGEGVGIGLSIVYKIIKDHKGTINYESEPGKGTTVTITLPVKLLA
jgi:PAS domain S-box-containing protein